MPPSKQSKKALEQTAQQPPKELSMQGTSEGKQPMRPPTEQFVQASSASKMPKNPPPQQVPAERSTQGTSKGKQPIRPPPEQPVQASSTSEKTQQLPFRLLTQADPKATQHPPKQPTKADAKGKQFPKPSATERVQDESKGKQPMRKPLSGNQRCIVARIPVERDGQIKRVKVFIAPDTAFRHPQTFFFKTLPDVDPYWGYLNDKASTAVRVIRLETEDNPTPYFLLVCRGEYPKATSPRNNNALFADMYEPIFNDAFVFRLGDPEVDENGYSRFVHVDEDIGSVDWLPGAIKDAARKVKNAVPGHANPGFPDLTNYADPETMNRDIQKLSKWRGAIARAEIKYGRDFPADADTGLPDLERMRDILEQWMRQFRFSRAYDVLSGEEEVDISLAIQVANFVEKMNHCSNAIEDNATTVNAARNASSGTKVAEAVEHVKRSFLAAGNSFIGIEGLGYPNIAQEVRVDLITDTETRRVDLKPTRPELEEILMAVDNWKMGEAIPSNEKSKASMQISAAIVTEAKGAYRRREEGGNKRESITTYNGVKQAHGSMGADVEETGNSKIFQFLGSGS